MEYPFIFGEKSRLRERHREIMTRIMTQPNPLQLNLNLSTMNFKDYSNDKLIALSSIFSALSQLFSSWNTEFVESLKNGQFLDELEFYTAIIGDIYTPEDYKNLKNGLSLMKSNQHKIENIYEIHNKIFSESSNKIFREVKYRNDAELQLGNIIADINGFYRAFGLQLSQKNPEFPDSITVEFEFVHYLLLKLVYGKIQNMNEPAEITGNAIKSFFKDHIYVWLSGFLEDFTKTFDDEFHRGLAEYIKNLMQTNHTNRGS